MRMLARRLWLSLLIVAVSAALVTATAEAPTTRQMGARIRKLRNAKGISQADLARKARRTRVYVTRLEAGRQDPSLSTINALGKALGSL